MIEVPEEAALAEIQSNRDLHALLLGYHGRTLRVRTVSIQRERSYYDSGVGGFMRATEDSTGTLLGLKLVRSESTRFHSREPHYGLKIALSWGDSLQVAAQECTSIEVLQQDTGKWKLIHRGSSFDEQSTKELSRYDRSI